MNDEIKQAIFVLTMLAIMALAVKAMASEPVWLSSNTATADTTKNLCTNSVQKSHRGIFHGACINTPATGTLTIYNSSTTATSPIAVITTTGTATIPCSFYDVAVSSGLTYTNSATANVTLLYTCY